MVHSKCFGKWWGIGFFVLVTLLFMAASPIQAEEPQYGGILVRVQGSQPAGNKVGIPWRLNPTLSPQVEPCFNMLVVQDANGEILPQLAESWKIASDYLSITFNLRKDVKFSDGTDFNASAAKWNFDMQLENKGTGVSNVKSVDVIDDYTIRLNLKQWDNSILNTIANIISNILFYSPTAYKEKGEEWASTHPVGTGPFILKSFDPNIGCEMVKNPNYWEKGKPYLDGIKQIYLTEPLAAVMALQNGEAQMLNLFRGSNVDLKAKLASTGYPMIAYKHGAGLYTMFPDSVNADSPLANKTVREAVEYAIDKETICATLGYNLWSPVYQNVPDGNAAHNPSIKGRHYDLNMAKQLVEKAGYKAGELKFNLYALASDSALAQTIQAMLKEAGITLDIQILDHPKWVGFMNGGWKNGLFMSAMPTNPLWLSAMVRPFGTPARSYVSVKRPKEFDEAFRKAQAATDYDTMIKLSQNLVKMAYDDVMAISLFEHEPDFNASEKVANPGFDVAGHWDSANVWLKK